MTDAPVTALIVDDEPIARAGLRRMLADVGWMRCVGEAASGTAAVAAIDELGPDLVFLDIEMPGLPGTAVLAQCRHVPRVVFTTAYAQHAAFAFEIGALDYLLKPFGEERLHATLERVRAAFGEPWPSPLDRLGEAMGRGPVARFFARSGRRIVPIAVADVLWLEAVGDYVSVNLADGAHVLHVALSRLEERLDPARFVRIHRARVVNLDHVRAFRSERDGQLVAEMSNGRTLGVSRSRAQELRRLSQ